MRDASRYVSPPVSLFFFRGSSRELDDFYQRIQCVFEPCFRYSALDDKPPANTSHKNDGFYHASTPMSIAMAPDGIH